MTAATSEAIFFGAAVAFESWPRTVNYRGARRCPICHQPTKATDRILLGLARRLEPVAAPSCTHLRLWPDGLTREAVGRTPKNSPQRDSTDSGRALSDFRVAKAPTDDRGGWSRVVRDLELALDGRLALSARVAERAATYRRRHRHTATAQEPSVAFDNEASGSATIIDVHAADGVGVLYRITRALAELDLDIRSAKAETRGTAVTDAFYVRDGRGAKITDASALAEITRAVIHGRGS